jgi:uncharacterized Fe-S cluster-containing radical SAM superfamily protein
MRLKEKEEMSHIKELPKLPFDPLKRAAEVEHLVMKGSSRKYYRFRSARYYGGIATADQVGCCLLCAYCWNHGRNLNPERSQGGYYTPDQVAHKLLDISQRKGFNKVRLSGAEPILGQISFEHFCQVLGKVTGTNPWLDFVLETNGLVFGRYPEFAAALSRYNRLQVRVCLKGWDEQSFEKISGADGVLFELPLRGLEYLLQNGIAAWPAVMYETFGPQGIEKISGKLRQHKIRVEELEVEYLEPYSFVVDNLKQRSISWQSI